MFLNYHLLRMLDFHQCLHFIMGVVSAMLDYIIPSTYTLTRVGCKYLLDTHWYYRQILSTFAEHQTRQFPVVGGPRAFAQPNNFLMAESTGFEPVHQNDGCVSSALRYHYSITPHLVGIEGFEPPTSRSQARRHSQTSLYPEYGGFPGTRTPFVGFSVQCIDHLCQKTILARL